METNPAYHDQLFSAALGCFLSVLSCLHCEVETILKCKIPSNNKPLHVNVRLFQLVQSFISLSNRFC